MLASVRILAVVDPVWQARYAGALLRAEIDANFVAEGDVAATILARDWSIDLVVVDLALATAALASRLLGDGPPVLAFGDPQNAGIALAANLADFVDDAPEPATLAAAIIAGIAVAPATGVADLSDRSASRLGALGAEAERVAAALARLAEPVGETPPIDLAAVRTLIRARRLRDRFFPADIFGEAAWDMLLDLTLAREEGRTVPVSSLCAAAAVPTTTALRAIHRLCGDGVFVRTSDPGDARRAFIALAEPTAAAMAAYLAKLG